jgi:mono/diheme cytochrome c family protein
MSKPAATSARACSSGPEAAEDHGKGEELSMTRSDGRHSRDRAVASRSQVAVRAGLLLGAVGLAAALSSTGVRAQEPAAEPDGAQVYATVGCSACHGTNGEGGVGPALAGNTNIDDATVVINQVLNGGEIMPPIGQGLTDAQVAAVINFVRSSWGNTAAEPVTAEQVATVRG